MLTGRVGCTHPHTIEQARNDFKIYMSKLLEHSAALDTFRRDGRQLEGGGGEGTPPWGSQGRPRESTGSRERSGTNPPAGEVYLSAAPTFEIKPPYETENNSSPPKYFRDKQSWPRAGAKTPPAPKPSANFSWATDPARGESSALAGVGRELFTVDRRREVEEQGSATFPPGSARARDDCFAAAGDELDGAPEEDWKAVWARRFARGSIQSEYQDRFPWPTPLRPWANSSLARAAPPLKASSIPFATDEVSRRGSTSGAPPLETLRTQRSASSLELSARGSDGDRGAATVRTTKEAGGEVIQAEDAHPESLPSRQPRQQPPPSVRAPDAAMVEIQGPEKRDFIVSDNVAQSVPGSDQASAWEVMEPGDIEGSDGGGREEEMPETVAWKSRAVEVGSSRRGARWVDEEEALSEPGAGEAVASKSGARRVEVKKEAFMTGGRTLDYSSHHSTRSVMTEYMEEFAWPAERPAPGQRGKRTGMGMDQVGRLLSGKRAEESQKLPDPSVVARLGVAADRALKAASHAHLAEMCRLKSPPPTARRLVLGLAVALGLRWRRWSDIRIKLLGNKRELMEFLQRFDKDRAGLTSASLHPFVEDPSLSPAEIRHVAASVVWLSRWLRALHDYLAVREGKEHDFLLSRMPVGNSRVGGSGEGATRRGRRSSSLARKKIPGTVPRTVRESAAMKDSGGGGGGGVSAGVDLAEGVDLSSAAGLAGGRAVTASLRNKHTQKIAVGSAAEGGRQDKDRRRDQHRASTQAAATQGFDSFRPRSFIPDGEEERDGGVGKRAEAASTHGGERGRGNFGSESVWTAGTVTSRGDVLETPTEDQADVGSTSVMREPNATTTRDRLDCDASGDRGGRDAGRRPTRPQSMVDRRGRGCTVSSPVEENRRDAVEAKAVRRKCKGETASRFANPKARRPPIERRNPILAHPRWPPPAGLRERDRTEQRSAFFLGRSSAA